MSNQFNFRYTAPNEEERKEIESIRRQYIPQNQPETKLDKLRRYDKRVKSVSKGLSLGLGIIGTLIFGVGLTMILEWSIWLWGIVLMVVGGVVITINYPLYKLILARYKKRYCDEILRLSEELLNDNVK